MNADDIYSAYPKKVGKPAALRAITTALQTIEADKLLSLTRQYAEAVAGSDLQFVPHPSTFFNQRRFDDDPATWRRGSRPSTAVAPVAGKYAHLDGGN